MIECKNCGTLNPDNANFCNGCGAKLELSEDNAKSVNVPIVNENSTKEVSKETGNKIVGIILNATIILSVILGIISVFLPFGRYEYEYMEVSYNYNIDFWFSDVWEFVKNPSNSNYVLAKVEYIFGFVLFIFAMIGVIVFGIIALTKAITSLCTGKYSNKTMLLAFATLVLPFVYALYTIGFVSLYSSASASITYTKHGLIGSSQILLIVAISILVLSLAIAKFLDYKLNNEGKLVSIILDTISSVLVVVMSFIAFAGNIKMNYNVYWTQTCSFGIGASLNSDYVSSETIGFATVLFAITIFGIISLVPLFIALGISNKITKAILSIACGAFSMLVGIEIAIMSRYFTAHYLMDYYPGTFNDFYNNAKLGPTSIVMIVLSVIIIGVSIAGLITSAIKKRKNTEVE